MTRIARYESRRKMRAFVQSHEIKWVKGEGSEPTRVCMGVGSDSHVIAVPSIASAIRHVRCEMYLPIKKTSVF
jgi:hypothetical protein